MGATLPAIARWVETTPRGVAWLGFFYGGNIAGAVFGCLLAGFYLLPVYSMETATLVAASINGVVALVALGLSAGTTGAAAADGPVQDRSTKAPRSGLVYAAIALSGMAALGAEVVWTRLLSLMLGATVYTFSIILAVFLLALGVGSGLGAWLSRSTARPRTVLAWCQFLLVGAVAWAAYMMAASLPHWPINPALSLSPWYTFQLDLARCLWAVFPAALLWGASFPLALAGVASRGQDPGRLVGGVYAVNTLGAILGSLVFSLVVVPALGTQWAQRLLMLLSVAAALLALSGRDWQASPEARSDPRRPSSAGGLAVLGSLAAALALVAWLAWSVPSTPWGIVAYGRHMATYGRRLAPGIIAEADIPPRGDNPDIFCTYLGEGRNGSVAVTKWRSGARNFHSAGKVQASTEPRDMRLQRMLGHLPALVHPKPESVLVVACGAGVTAGTFVLHPDLKRLVICDIEPLVPRAVAPQFEQENYGVVKDPRTEIVLDDGRHFLRTTRETFDVITSDPIDPWVKGCAALNTLEYYTLCKAHLKPGGVMTLWMPLYESNLESAKSLMATFFKVFPDGVLWSNDSEAEGYDAVLFGQAEPTVIDLDVVQDRFQRDDHARVRQSLAAVGFHTALGLLATYAGQAPDLQPWLRDAQLNTDRNLRLQYLAGMWFNASMGSEILAQIHSYYRFPDHLFRGSVARRQTLKYALEGPPPATQ
jgi:spermidine synthase